MKNEVSIIGYGRFGKTLHRLLGDDFYIRIYDTDTSKVRSVSNGESTEVASSLKQIYESTTIFFAVPIEVFESVANNHAEYFTQNHILIDVLSVKTHPQTVFDTVLQNSETQALLTHPMFGPDSAKDGFDGLPIVVDKYRASDETYTFWKNFFADKKLDVVELSPEKHDQLAARSQGVTHFIGRLLDEYGFGETQIDTLGAKRLQQVMDQTTNDTWELFMNLQNYNPYTKKMRVNLGKAYDRLYNKLIPEQQNEDETIYGIQGGPASFNEQAINHYMNQNEIKTGTISYLHTTERVLRKLHEGDIDYGLFAIENSVGGLVEESIRGMAQFKIEIVEEFAIKITHHLMKRKDVQTDEITQVMAHPQVLKQCQTTLKEKYPNLKTISGEGDLIDTANAAKAIVEDEIDTNTAILGPRNITDLYGLEIIDENLQDNSENFTSFLLVKRYKSD